MPQRQPPENDENLVQKNAQERPSDDDRARFGFKMKGSKAAPAAVKPPTPTPKVETVVSAPAPASLVDQSVDLNKVICDTLGDPDEVLPILNLKPTAGKYDFKDQITELKDLIRPLKNTVSDQRLKAKSLIQALEKLEPEINDRLHTATVEISSLREALQDSSQNLARARHDVAARTASEQQVVAALEAAKRENVTLHERSAAEALRADKAGKSLSDALMQIEHVRGDARKQAEKAAEFQRLLNIAKEDCKTQIDEAADLLRKQAGDSKQGQQKLIEEHIQKESSLAAELDHAKARIEELGKELMDTQATRDGLSQNCKDLQCQIDKLVAEAGVQSRASEEREALLQAKLVEKDLDMEKSASQLQRDALAREEGLLQKMGDLQVQHERVLEELEMSAKEKEAEASAALMALKAEQQVALDDKDEQLTSTKLLAQEALETLQQQHVAQLDEKDRQLAQKLSRRDGEHQEILESTKATYQAQIHEKDALLVQKEEDARDSIDSIKKIHQAQLTDMEGLLRQKDADMKESIASIKRFHQAQLTEKDDQLKQKDAEATRGLEALQVMHATQLIEKDAVLQQKESESRNNAASVKSMHQAQIKKMEELLKQKEEEWHDAVASLKRSHELQLDENDEMMKQKESDSKNKMEAMERAHQTQADEKDRLAKKKECALEEMIETMKIQIAEKDELLKNKDASLRDSLQSMQLLQSSGNEQLQLERQRVARLEAEVSSLRASEDELRNDSAGSLRQVDRLQSELSTLRQQVADLRSLQQRLEAEKEQQAEKACERQAVLQEENTQLRVKLGALQEELSGTKTLAEAKSQNCDRLTQERDALEVEFRSYKEHHGSSNQQQMEAITELKLTVDKLGKQVETTKGELQIQQGSLSQHQGYIQSLEAQLARAEGTRRELHNTIQELKGNIRVFCRIRPHLSSELALHSPEANKLNLAYANESYGFNFDRVFDAGVTQEGVFDEVHGLVQSALDGYKVCVFAYGQTGSGKTFTMQGDQARGAEGLIPRSLSKIFQASEAMRAAGWEWTLKASFLEIYNEAIRDLLSNNNKSGAGTALVHVIKHDDAWGTVVTNLTTVEVGSIDQISRLMEKAAKVRAVGATDMNAVSSRSHSVFALYLHGVNRELNSELHGALHLVDLAGSERLDKSAATGDRLKETQSINRSLSSLTDVFLAKAENRSHVPFRNSKLTHLMEPCLNGQGKTLMVVNVGPEADNAHETLCALRFASQVSQCTTGGKPKRSTRPASAAAATSSRATTQAVKPGSATLGSGRHGGK
eukprot:TRINITY_DN17095_c0_g1_i1.p1 TRINITY_DN17095_c0_g1~~TRINITY_DN17095_c0_g1_i1.p1  ORF type:complete len:1279 (-),score=367.86 TRINITY_DN17095_c0_g1_i1:352-4188(-)